MSCSPLKEQVVHSYRISRHRLHQLRFDDTTGQISAQLQSSHAASQLNLGKLSHPKAQAESEDRGEGFELRTDQWGAIRAGEGLLITTHAQEQAQLNQFAGDSINLTTQKNLIAQASQKISLFAAQNGIKQVAGKGKVEIQAQGDGLDILAKAGIQIISTEDTVYFNSPKEIVLKAESSELKLNGSGIFPTTGGKFEVKAGQHLFVGGQKVPIDIPLMPNEIRKQLLLQYHDQEPVQGANFTIKYANGQRYSGITNNKGIADIQDAPEGEAVVTFGEDQRPYQVIAIADENPEHKADWAMDDFEASYQQALKEKNK